MPQTVSNDRNEEDDSHDMASSNNINTHNIHSRQHSRQKDEIVIFPPRAEVLAGSVLQSKPSLPREQTQFASLDFSSSKSAINRKYTKLGTGNQTNAQGSRKNSQYNTHRFPNA
jgi:hypothetical protein